MEQKNKTVIITLAVLVVIIAGAFFGYRAFWPDKELQSENDTALQTQVDAVNPFNETKIVNPFEEGANPYENIKTNPFE